MPISDVGLQVPPRHSPGSAKGENSVLLRFSYTAIGLSAFLLTCLGLRAVLPFPEIDEVTQKLRFFAAHKDDFDTIFIGSSRIYHQISPTVFDQVMRENEIPTRTFNFGVDGMHLPESAYVLERVLATRPRILKYVFIELGELQTKWPHEIEGSRRALYWHDWRRTSLVLRKILGLYPNFYRKGVRVDQEHMDGVGAEEFTQLLAEKFAQLIWEGRIK